MRIFLVAALALVLVAFAPRAASACGHGGSSGGLYTAAIVILLGGVAVDVGFSLHDLGVDSSSRASGVAEVLLMAPQVYFGAAFIRDDLRNHSGVAPAALFTAWTAAMLAHGIYAIAVGEGRSEDERAEVSRAAGTQPRLALGMTFVDLAPRSAPGLGVIGRF